MERAISLSSSDMWWRAIIEGFGGEGRGGYIEMATLPNTAKWITPDNYSITRFLQHNQFPENFSSHLFMNPAREFRKSEPCVFFEGDYRYGFGCSSLYRYAFGLMCCQFLFTKCFRSCQDDN